ncbi:MAG: glycosyltransferase, partial [Candidatus Binatia bacterium]
MRIAQVIHTFPPYSVGGSENYTLALSQELQRQGHRVAIFHRIADATKEEYAVEHGEVEGLPVWRLNHVFRDSDQFEKLYQDAAIDQRFAAFLDAFQPDVIHIHHLTCLSTSSVFEARKRGCPVVMTLHDYWLICQRGQFLKTDLTLCPGQEDRECVKCLTRELVVSEANKKIMTTYRRLLPGVPSPLRWLAAQLRKAYVRYYGQFFVQRRDDAVQKVRRRMDHI